MRTVQMTLDEGLVREVDRMAKTLKTTRSAFTRDALRQALGNVRKQDQEARHKAGYAKNPVGADEFGGWEKEQVWGDK